MMMTLTLHLTHFIIVSAALVVLMSLNAVMENVSGKSGDVMRRQTVMTGLMKKAVQNADQYLNRTIKTLISNRHNN